MGQQQLLLLVLGIVIVGLAVVVGIQAFGENQKKANADALVNDGVRIASDTQAWVLKPAAFGGGNGAPEGVNFTSLGYNVTDGKYTNLNGVFTMAASTASVIISGENVPNSNFVKVGVFGTSPECIVTAIGSTAPADPTKPATCLTGAF
jgi:hypothetical protein